jgi:hypothetical protein
VARQPDAATKRAPQNNQLMSERGVLSLKPDLRLEWRGQDGQNETEQPDHFASLGDSITSSTRIRFSVHTPKFMIDKNTGNAVGEIFHGSPKWQIAQRGTAANSLVSQGTVVGIMGPVAVYKVIVYSFDQRKEKPFVVEDHGNLGFFEIFSGTCN